ncbi:MAG: hypothetical protein ACKVQJ_05980 [Pyrinomonadaceae bacterium]
MKVLLSSGVKPLYFSRLICVLIFVGLTGGCSVAATKNIAAAKPVAVNSADESAAPKGATIAIDAGGPADTVRAFYKLLREKKFREAMFLTNLRPAVEGLTDTELKDFSLDFEAIAGQVPAEIEINGEITSGDNATVTANLPNADGDKNEIQTIKLRRENGVWVIMTADDESAKKIKADGKNYFYNLRIETHEEEARKMLERISKAELAHSLQNGGVCAEMQTLIAAGLLPDDIRTSQSTGYNFELTVTTDKKHYFATATPAEYAKSGKLSFLLSLDNKGLSHVTSKDTGGKILTK